MKALIACLLGACVLRAESPPRIPAPLYTPSSIVNAASFKVGPLAPNTIGTLYGRDLAFLTRSLAAEDIYNGTLPTTLLGTGVRLLIKNTVAFIYFVSPTQVNFLVPSTLTPGPADLLFSLDGRYGEAVRIQIAEFSPALFQLDPETILATRPDGSVINGEKPAKPGDVVILYATGLGATRPRMAAGQIPTSAAILEKLSEFKVVAGVSRSTARTFFTPEPRQDSQVCIRSIFGSPATFARNPELQIGFNNIVSPTGIHLPLEAGNP